MPAIMAIVVFYFMSLACGAVELRSKRSKPAIDLSLPHEARSYLSECFAQDDNINYINAMLGFDEILGNPANKNLVYKYLVKAANDQEPPHITVTSLPDQLPMCRIKIKDKEYEIEIKELFEAFIFAQGKPQEQEAVLFRVSQRVIDP